MTLNKAMQNMKFDVRMIEYNMNNGQMTKEELKAYLQNLQDSSANAAPITLEDTDDTDSSESH